MRFDILTIFPDLISDFCGKSILGRATGLRPAAGHKASGRRAPLEIRARDIRAFSTDKRRKVDDRPFGGGPGMVMKIEPIYRTLKSLRLIGADGKIRKSNETRVILTSAKGKQLTQKDVVRLSKHQRIVVICGRYEGVDERVAKNLAHEEVSIGPYVLQGGEIAALAIIEAVSRCVPGVLGNVESLKEESHGKIDREYPQYTRPEIFVPQTKGAKKIKWTVPKVILSGDHKKIAEWRKKSK